MNAVVQDTRLPPARVRKVELPYSWIAVIVLLGLWQFACSLFTSSAFLVPAPTAIAADLWHHWRDFLPHIWTTTLEILVGFAGSIALGIPVAIMLTFSRVLDRSLYPLIVGSQVVPKVAIAPVMLAVFGYGMTPKVAIIITIAFFPIVINAVVGLRSAPPQMIHLARSMGASNAQVFWRFRLPQALPSLMAGIKMASVLAVIGAVVAEFVGSDSGLGYLVVSAASDFNVTRQFAAILLLSALGMAFFWVTELAERYLLPWHVSNRRQE
jgi:NitT/TauT family transport system permease protein